MSITLEQAEKLLKGDYKFKQLGFSMMLTRMKELYFKAPSPASLHHCTSEINMYLEKFKAIMGADYAVITNL